MNALEQLGIKTIEVPSNWGGDRPNSGRHRTTDKRQQVYVGIKQSEIQRLGGKEQVQKIMLEAVAAAILEKMKGAA